MSGLAERFIEPSGSTEMSPFEPVDGPVNKWPLGEAMLPPSSHRPRLVNVDHKPHRHLYPVPSRSVDVGQWADETTIDVGMDTEPALHRTGAFTAGSLPFSSFVTVFEWTELKSGSDSWFDVTIPSGYTLRNLPGLIGPKWAPEYSNEKDLIPGIADLDPNRAPDSTLLLVHVHHLPVFARELKRRILEDITTYASPVTGYASETTQEGTEFVLDRIAKLRRTPEDERAPWATWPDERAFDDAVMFARAWSSDTIRIPDVGLADDGEVNFLWKGADVHVDLGFYGDGTFSYYARDGDGKEYTDDDVPACVGLPTDLLAILKHKA